jgi:hypothetical protein
MTAHIPTDILTRYAVGEPLDDALAWPLEAHLETCARCRAELTAAVGAGRGSTTAALVEAVHTEVTQRIAVEPLPVRHRPWTALRRGAVWSLAPWCLMTIGALLAALMAQDLFTQFPSMVLLSAPIAPLILMSAAWSRRTDLAWELLAASPRSGWEMLLRRTLLVLVLVAPILAVFGWWAGQSPELWLLPCLAFTGGSLALGSWIGVRRASVGLAVAWAVAVILPSLATKSTSVVLDGSSMVAWAVVVVAVTAVVVVRRHHFRLLASLA